MSCLLPERRKQGSWAHHLLAVWLAVVFLLFIAEPWPELEVAWLAGLVLLVTARFWKRSRAPLIAACAGVLLITSVWLAIQWLPLYSTGWGTLESVEIRRFPEPWITLTGPAELSQLEAYGARGSNHYLRKIGGSYEMWVHERGRSTHYFVHNDSLGPRSGAFFQPTFRPSQPDSQPPFREWFDATLMRHGHPRPVGFARESVPVSQPVLLHRP